MVDSGAPDLADRLMGSLRPLSGGRVATVFNTALAPGAHRSERDPAAGRRDDRRPRKHAAVDGDSDLDPGGRSLPAGPPQTAHPTKTYSVDGSMNAGGEPVDYGYLIDAHTSIRTLGLFRANISPTCRP